MIRNQDIICISSIDWDFIWQGHQEIMATLAANGNRVLFIENTGVRAPRIRDLPRLKKRIKDYLKGVKGIRQERDNLYICSPIVLPFPYSWLARRINKFLILSVMERWMNIIDFTDPIIWTFLPTGISLDIINSFNKKLVVYYCIDNFSASSSSAKKVRFTEEELLKKSDLVFVTSQALYEYCIKYNKNISIFPFGVNVDNFEKVRILNTASPEEFKDITKPIVGYVGGIHKWIDQDLVKHVASSRPDLDFVFVGPIQTDVSALSGIKNIHFLGNKEHAKLPYLIKYFTLAIIPYVISDYTKNVYPTKLNEYLLIGKPVISTDLPEIRSFNEQYKGIIYISKDAGEFADCLSKAEEEDNESLRMARIEVARKNSWQSRIEQMSSLIEEAIIIRMRGREKEWKEDLLFFYRTARRKFLRLAFVFVLAYGFIFYTPFIWVLAEPLKIAQKPLPADAIVVFAGGVGESGKPAQGYEERVQYAVDLYKQGLAKNILFSSGYMYVYKEPLVMKALAVALGIPQDAVILEEEAANTYENVKFVSRILRKRGWNNIVLVSASYHMRRAVLVFNKIAKDIKVYSAPVPIAKSHFYSHPDRDKFGRKVLKRVNLRQIRAIFHEYSSIFYYWWKGYL